MICIFLEFDEAVFICELTIDVNMLVARRHVWPIQKSYMGIWAGKIIKCLDGRLLPQIKGYLLKSFLELVQASSLSTRCLMN